MARSRTYLVSTLAATILGFAWAGAAEAQVHGDTVVGPGDSIQAAIDGAASGDTIVVFGRHRENVAIVKDGLTLRGVGAVILPPITPAAHACFDPTQEGEAVHGICVSGDVDVDTGEVSRYVKDVTVSGFTIRNFTGSGINLTAARDATIAGNVTVHNFESGIAASAAPGTRMLFNRASGTDRAAFFVFRSPAVSLIGNVAEDSRFGIQIGDTLHGRLVANSVHDNCVGVLVVADEPGPAGEFRIAGNRIKTNTRACPANEDSPAVSGAGVVMFGAAGNTIVHNLISGNVPAGESLVSAGVAVIAGPDGTPPIHNVVKRNAIFGNYPDIFWDRTGTANVFRPNRCRSSTPPSLCS